MKIILIGTAIFLLLILLFLVLSKILYKRDMKKTKYDLLDYLKKHQDTMSITINENGIDTLTVNSNEKFPLASTIKIIIAFNFIKGVTNNKFAITDKVKLSELEEFYIPNTDGGAHPNWKKSIDHPTETSLLEVAKGMMRFSSNACTDFLINKIGLDVINTSIETLRMNHDNVTYMTPLTLMPGYLADKRNIAINKLEAMDEQLYQELSTKLFQKMKANETAELEKKAIKMLNRKVQLSITNRFPSSTTKEYANLLYRLGTELLTKKEKELLSEIMIGENIKTDEDNYCWYKGGSTLFVLTSAIYKESDDETISVSLFIKDNQGMDLIWINNTFNDFVRSILTDTAFRKMVKSIVS